MSADKLNCRVYVACRMTGRDRTEQIERANYVRAIFALAGIEAISPVISEGVQPEPGVLLPTSREELLGNWTRDKVLIMREAHVVLLDGADDGSVGMAREYAYNRYCLWKPTVILWHKPRGLTVAEFEDDAITTSVLDAALFIRKNYGTRCKRWRWRVRMLTRSIPKWLLGQLYAWR